MIKCKVYLCPNSNTIMRHIGRLCESAIYTCKNGTEINYCNEAQYFDVLTRTCVQNPVERGCVDEETFDSTARPPTTPSTTTISTTPAPTTASPDDCYDSIIECREYQCPNVGQTEILCKKAFQTCNIDQVTFYCSDLNYFNYRTRQCVDSPFNRGCIEIPEEAPSTTTEQVTTAIAVDPSLLTFTFTVTCSVETPRPREDRLAQYYCTDFPSCLRGQEKKVELCLKYLQCVRADNEWKAIVMECPPGLFFSYENDICTTKPEGGCPFERTNRIFNF
ncbi:UNVERIFIED_CONTAM: hypothetical protein RMT77_000550 [Armadillidium vulgare]